MAILNNDVIVPPSWLPPLIAQFERNPQLGMVGTMTNLGPKHQVVQPLSYPTFRPAPTEAGPAPNAGWKHFLAALLEFARVVQERNTGGGVDAAEVGGGCALLRKSCFRKLNSFPARSALGHFDLPGLSQRVRQAGFGLAVCAEIFTHSFGIRATDARARHSA